MEKLMPAPYGLALVSAGALCSQKMRHACFCLKNALAARVRQAKTQFRAV
jgi:hypothetical protein